MEGPNKPVRTSPRMEWLYDVMEWCNMDIYGTFTAAENREMWVAIMRAAVDRKVDTSPQINSIRIRRCTTVEIGITFDRKSIVCSAQCLHKSIGVSTALLCMGKLSD